MVKNFHFLISSRQALGPALPLIYWIREVVSRGLKPPGREADHSSPNNAEVKIVWLYISTPLYVFTAQCLNNSAQGKFYLLPYQMYTLLET
jgi:hypothetical protein